jgi:hypothetical protein
MYVNPQQDVMKVQRACVSPMRVLDIDDGPNSYRRVPLSVLSLPIETSTLGGFTALRKMPSDSISSILILVHSQRDFGSSIRLSLCPNGKLVTRSALFIHISSYLHAENKEITVIDNLLE